MPDAELDPVIRWELQWLADLDLLDDREVICDVESVWKRRGWGRGWIGALVLTDARLLFISTNAVVRRPRVESYRIQLVVGAEMVESPRWGRDHGALKVTVQVDSEETSELQFERVEGGASRAEELAAAILRQRNLSTGSPGGS